MINVKYGKSEFEKFSVNLLALTGKGGQYNKQYLDGCADFMLTNKKGMRNRAFGGEQDPTTGEAWADLAPATQAERKKLNLEGNRNKLRRSNTLRDEIRKNTETGNIIIGTDTPYAKKHQTQGVGAKKIKRKFLGVNADDFRGFNQVFTRLLKKIEQLAKGT